MVALVTVGVLATGCGSRDREEGDRMVPVSWEARFEEWGHRNADLLRGFMPEQRGDVAEAAEQEFEQAALQMVVPMLLANLEDPDSILLEGRLLTAPDDRERYAAAVQRGVTAGAPAGEPAPVDALRSSVVAEQLGAIERDVRSAGALSDEARAALSSWRDLQWPQRALIGRLALHIIAEIPEPQRLELLEQMKVISAAEHETEGERQFWKELHGLLQVAARYRVQQARPQHEPQMTSESVARDLLHLHASVVLLAADHEGTVPVLNDPRMQKYVHPGPEGLWRRIDLYRLEQPLGMRLTEMDPGSRLIVVATGPFAGSYVDVRGNVVMVELGLSGEGDL